MVRVHGLRLMHGHAQVLSRRGNRLTPGQVPAARTAQRAPARTSGQGLAACVWRKRPQAYTDADGTGYFGEGPYWFAPGVESMHSKTNSTKPPNGMKEIRYQAPERPVSWSRRMFAAREGSARARRTSTLSAGTPQVIWSMTLATATARTKARTNHQYSERRARPEKVAYLRRHVETASVKDMDTPGKGEGGAPHSVALPSGYRYPRTVWGGFP